ncbi:ADP-ribose pyrophosphatase YjhB (NUDIX family) [Peribacillus deserti]|uniref:ADP-ribose pyrophosphatase YjhB (NUDIX family) n=1 Tax=Peribacillus deserti TaxID=673318 RepID=A0ABS2QCX6_9BACI|nr:NUDIX hydrolase [Peribacillus deserti]MBM7690850.1 ADP-ribose pyrophosphatase YjhB (NUDIX family) [Peribacillus deserti]
MEKWYGSAGVCVKEKGQVLMVLQGRPDEEKVWSVPSGGLEAGETFEECCIREVWEETGYRVEIVRPLYIKEGTAFGIEVEVHYFELKLIGGMSVIQDPDELIHDIDWKSADELRELDLSFPEDLENLLGFLRESEHENENVI